MSSGLNMGWIWGKKAAVKEPERREIRKKKPQVTGVLQIRDEGRHNEFGTEKE